MVAYSSNRSEVHLKKHLWMVGSETTLQFSFNLQFGFDSCLKLFLYYNLIFIICFCYYFGIVNWLENTRVLFFFLPQTGDGKRVVINLSIGWCGNDFLWRRHIDLVKPEVLSWFEWLKCQFVYKHIRFNGVTVMKSAATARKPAEWTD